MELADLAKLFDLLREKGVVAFSHTGKDAAVSIQMGPDPLVLPEGEVPQSDVVTEPGGWKNPTVRELDNE